MDIKKFRKYYLLDSQHVINFMKKYKDKIVHLVDDFNEITDKLIENGYWIFDEDKDCFFLEGDSCYDYQFDFSEESFMMDRCETDTLVILKKDGYYTPLYCIQEAWDYMEEEITTIDKSETVTSDKYENLILKMLNNPKVVEDVNQLRQSAHLSDAIAVKILKVCLK